MTKSEISSKRSALVPCLFLSDIFKNNNNDDDDDDDDHHYDRYMIIISIIIKSAYIILFIHLYHINSHIQSLICSQQRLYTSVCSSSFLHNCSIRFFSCSALLFHCLSNLRINMHRLGVDYSMKMSGSLIQSINHLVTFSFTPSITSSTSSTSSVSHQSHIL